MVINSCNDMFHDLSIYTVMICSLMLRDLLEQRRFNKQNLNTTWFKNSFIQNTGKRNRVLKYHTINYIRRLVAFEEIPRKCNGNVCKRQ